jgi:hypothetical protein
MLMCVCVMADVRTLRGLWSGEKKERPVFFTRTIFFLPFVFVFFLLLRFRLAVFLMPQPRMYAHIQKHTNKERGMMAKV